MKKNLLIIGSALMLLICCTECKIDNEDITVKDDKKETVKNDSNELHVNIVLYNQPLDTIQKYIQGKWKLAYGKGGVTGRTMFYCDCDNCFIEFTSDNKVITNFVVEVTQATPIIWVKDYNTYVNDSTYLMTFKPDSAFLCVYALDSIYNDTLLFHEKVDDGVYFRCVKVQ